MRWKVRSANSRTAVKSVETRNNPYLNTLNEIISHNLPGITSPKKKAVLGNSADNQVKIQRRLFVNLYCKRWGIVIVQLISTANNFVVNANRFVVFLAECDFPGFRLTEKVVNV
jgi:hypothetical protein